MCSNCDLNTNQDWDLPITAPKCQSTEGKKSRTACKSLRMHYLMQCPCIVPAQLLSDSSPNHDPRQEEFLAQQLAQDHSAKHTNTIQSELF